MFAGPLRFTEHCPGCALDFTQFNVGDGPAAFLTLAIGALVTLGAVVLELTLHPPFWVHPLLWIPIALGAVVGALRVGKGALLAIEYRNQAREGRIDTRTP